MKYILAFIVAFAAWWLWGHGFSAGISSVQDLPTPLTQVREVDKQYYRQVFDYAMATVPAGKTYGWDSYSAKGKITPGEAFVSKSEYSCRNFKEVVTMLGQEKHNEGVACKRKGQDGWCRLDVTEAQTCALEKPADIFGGLTLGGSDAIESAKGTLGKLEGWIR